MRKTNKYIVIQPIEYRTRVKKEREREREHVDQLVSRDANLCQHIREACIAYITL